MNGDVEGAREIHMTSPPWSLGQIVLHDRYFGELMVRFPATAKVAHPAVIANITFHTIPVVAHSDALNSLIASRMPKALMMHEDT